MLKIFVKKGEKIPTADGTFFFFPEKFHWLLQSVKKPESSRESGK
jgi:hypothetical protein